MDLSELWKSTPAVAAAVVAVAGALYKAIKTLLEFNDEYLSKRQFKRHSFLRAEAEQHKELTAFIEAVRHEAVFHSTFGRPASPRMAAAIMAAYQSGNFSLKELRASYQYSKIGNDGSLVVTPGKSGVITLGFSIFFIVATALYSAATVISVLSLKSIPAFLTALVLLSITFGIFWIFGRDARSVLLAKNVERKLLKMSLAQPDLPPLKAQPIAAVHGEL
ncbi:MULTISPECIES: hypothetical protein [Comamonas]|jgi:hypothetical protein|uniref:hypothetical protein n=1 Tax=Comamonas TaxID=283 RepID=UPI002580A508|nr:MULTISPECIES: hypothetical protein [Comamonas]